MLFLVVSEILKSSISCTLSFESRFIIRSRLRPHCLRELKCDNLVVCLDAMSVAHVVGESFLSISLDLLRGTRLVATVVEQAVTSSLLEREIKRVALISR